MQARTSHALLPCMSCALWYAHAGRVLPGACRIFEAAAWQSVFGHLAIFLAFRGGAALGGREDALTCGCGYGGGALHAE
jgi:hypothetical protein